MLFRLNLQRHIREHLHSDSPVLNMNEKVTTSYTIAHTVSGTVLVRLAKTTFRGANSETSIAFRCYSPYKTQRLLRLQVPLAWFIGITTPPVLRKLFKTIVSTRNTLGYRTGDSPTLSVRALLTIAPDDWTLEKN